MTISPELLAFGMFAGVLILVIAGVPLYMALSGLALFFGMIGGWGPKVYDQFVFNVYGIISSEVLPAVPLFICMGLLLEKSGVADNLFESFFRAFGKMSGGLAIATVVLCTLFAACTGVVGASVTTMGLVALPSMLKHGYDKRLATGVICAGGTLGILIPPSLMLLLYGPMAGLSVSKLFMGAMFPGLLLSFVYIVYISSLCRIKPEMAPIRTTDDDEEPMTGGKFRRNAIDLIYNMLPTLCLILAVLGSIFLGIASPTEAAAVGSLGAIFIAAIYRKVSVKMLYEVALSTLKVTAMVMFVTLGAILFGGVFMALNGATTIGSLIIALPFGKWGIFAVMMIALFILGMFIDWIGILFIVVPVLTPVALSFGFDPLWFAIVVCVNLQMSFLSPPFAYAIFYLKGVAPPEVETSDIIKGVIPFMALQMIVLALVTVFPKIITWLPSIAG